MNSNRKNQMVNDMLGAAIKEARLKKDLTLEEVAIRANVANKSLVRKYEIGMVAMRIDIFIKICKVLDLDYKKVLTDVANKI